MPRTQARFCTLDKVDDDWLSLTVDEQWLYGVLLRQHRLTLIGVLDVIPQRWCSAGDITKDRVVAALNGLDKAGFVVVDRDTDEVLVRTFVRHDIDTSRLSTATRAGLWNAWRAISSPTLRVVAVTEIPDGVWEKLKGDAPPEAAEIRRSPPLKREPQHPQEREPASPHERPSSLLPPPTSLPSSSPQTTFTGRADDDPGAAAEDRDQTIRQTASLIGRAIATTAGKSTGYAASVTRRILTDPDPEDRNRIAELLDQGRTPEAIAAGWEPSGHKPPPIAAPPLQPVTERPDCDTCDGRGWLSNPGESEARRCTCNPHPAPLVQPVETTEPEF